MKQILLFLVLCLPLQMAAQNDWERPENSKQDQKATSKWTTPDQVKAKKPYEYAEYLEDVVPVVDGEVVWTKTFSNNKDAETNYKTMLDYLTALTSGKDQLETSNVSLVNKKEHSIVCHVEEWLTFSSSLLALDRTRLSYTIIVQCQDNNVDVKVFRISYLYDEERKPQRYKAEKWITDEYAINKKHTRLLPQSGKFRRKTVDRMNSLFRDIQTTLSLS